MVDQLMRHRVLDIYVQCLDVRHDMTLPETLQSDSDDMELEGRQAPRDIVELDGMEEIMGYADDRPDRPKERSVQPVSDTLGLDERLGEAVRDSVNQENTSDNSRRTKNAPNTNPRDEAGPTHYHANVVSSYQRQKKRGKAGKAKNDEAGPTLGHGDVVSSSQRQKMEGKALKGKEKTEGTQGSLKVIKGACIDGVILGREAPHHASFISY
ncbi:hypothetical protein J5N97_030249 [Dioscorea zingiberensis]|uniref:Uncharacterized protein n=1 Tax=Dioscorea zingiberensis TaxID=325984 RepID=A0A9D5BX47_9LILI|nr:hypothetical protein J5N97_030249 [Dioscorea zingiberensis]